MRFSLAFENDMNVGNFDRVVRVSIGLALILGTVFGRIGPWGWLGVIPLLTGLVRICPLYSALKISTISAKSEFKA